MFICLSTKFVGEFLSDRPKMSLGFGFDLNWIAWDEQSCSNHARCPQNKLVLCSLLFLLFSFSVTIFFFYELHKSNFYGEHFFCIIFFCLNSSAAVVFYHLQIANLILRYENIIWCSYLNVALCCYWFQSFWKKSKKCLFFLFLQFKSMKNIRI